MCVALYKDDAINNIISICVLFILLLEAIVYFSHFYIFSYLHNQF
jgi:hypothetical protein